VLARIVAVVLHEVLEPVLAEYRKLDHECPPAPDPAAEHRYDVASTTAVVTERPNGWDHDQRRPVTAARFGFGPE
jgi:hypothetical protein